MATNTPQDDFHKTGLRLPKDLHSDLHAAAAMSGRSYNSEIVARLQQSFETRPPTNDDVLYLVSKFRQELAESQFDTHIVWMMLNEAVMMLTVFGQGLKQTAPKNVPLMELVEEWLVDAENLVKEGRERLHGDLDTAAAAFQSSTDELLERWQLRSGRASSAKLGDVHLSLPTIAHELRPATAEPAPVKRTASASKK
ncbi:Arc family DNA-binding protein [Methylibium sp.]|uniref:Arc family DNA-binding protein n=1 Tax=Methylibium sp. TaxID=2067992 RepID=UPI003D0CF804